MSPLSLKISSAISSYMALNYARFGSITEFGHNYLPEFVQIHKQFSLEYLPNNFKSLMHLPQIENGKIVIDSFGNFNIFLLNPAVLFFLAALLLAAIKKQKKGLLLSAVTLLCCVAYMLITMMHATMGGWHFGNRYFVDCIPWLFLPYISGMSNESDLMKWQVPFGIWGLCINMMGSIIVYNR